MQQSYAQASFRFRLPDFVPPTNLFDDDRRFPSATSSMAATAR